MNKKSAHKNGWRAVHQRTKSEKRTKLAIFVLALVVSVLLVGNLIKFTQNLFQPISQTPKQYSWSGDGRINLVIKSQTVSVLSFDPHQKEVTIVDIPGQVYTEVPGGYGSWQVRAIFDLGQSENPPKGPRLLSASMNQLMGLPIDGYIKSKDKTTDQIVDDFRSPMGVKDLLGNIQTDLSPIELIRLGVGLSSVRFDKVSNLNLMDQSVFSSEEIGGQQSLVADPLRLDSIIVKNFADSQIKSEQSTIAVFNATNKPGLAAQVARVISNMGGNVIIQSSLETREAYSYITGKDSYTKKRLSQVLCSGLNCDKIPTNSSDFRAQINLVLGEDFVK